MKYILISLLFCICYMGEAQFPHKVIAGDDLEIHYGPIVHDIKLTPDDLCRLMMMGYKISNSDTFTPKPLNIKMKPRWRDSILYIVKDYGDTGWLSKGGYDTLLHKGDSIKSKELKP